MRTTQDSQKGFTLLEILLVIATIAILASIVILALNPRKQLGQTNNAKRSVDVSTIINAVHQYAVDHQGAVPASIGIATNCDAIATNQICRSDATSCVGLVDLSPLTQDQKYLVSLPMDPSNATTNATGYAIVKSSNDRITVCAPHAEQGVVISITQ